MSNNNQYNKFGNQMCPSPQQQQQYSQQQMRQQSIQSNQYHQQFQQIQQQLQGLQNQIPVISQNYQQNGAGQNIQVEQKKNTIRIISQNPPQQQLQLQQPPRQIQEIMQYFYSERDQFIDQQFRNYLQQECNIDEMFKEYIPKQYQMLDIPEITQELDGYIRVRGDGNCFYNTFVYQYLIIVLQKSQENFQAWKDKFGQMQFVIKFEQSNPFNDQDCKQMNAAFFQLIESIYQQNTLTRLKDFQQKYSTNWNFLYQLSIIFCRSLISKCLESMRRNDNEKKELYDFAIQEVLSWEVDCNYNELVLDCINKYIHIPLKLYIFEKDSFRIMHYETGGEKESKVYILFRQGHYVIPKVKQIEKTNQSIVSYQEKFQLYQKQVQQQQDQQQLINYLQNEANDAQNKSSQYNQQLDRVKQELDRANKEIQQFKQRESQNQNKIKELDNQLQKELKQKRDLEYSFNYQSKQFQNSSEQIKQLNQKIVLYEGELQGFKQQNQVQKQYLFAYQEEISNLKQIIQKQQTQLQHKQYQSQEIQLNAEVAQLSKEEINDNKIQLINGSQIHSNQQSNEKVQQRENEGFDQKQINRSEIKIVYKDNLDPTIPLQFKYYQKRYYEINNFHLGLLVGYLQSFRKSKYLLLQEFQGIRPQCEKYKYLFESLEQLNLDQIDQIKSEFANIFFHYISQEFIISDESLEKVSKTLRMKLILIKQIEDKKFQKQEFNKFAKGAKEIEILISLGLQYYLPCID